VQNNVGQEVALMTRTLLSRPNLEKVARMTDMDLTATTPEAMEMLLNKLRHEITFTGSNRQNLYSISYADKNPQLAKNVVQSLLTLFVESSLGDSRKDSMTAQKFLNDQIKEYEAKLIAAEDALKEFKRKYMGLMPGEGKGYFADLQAAKEKLASAELQLKEVRNRRDELKRQLQDEEKKMEAATASGAHPAINTALDSRIETMQTRLDDLLLKYTDQHPDVVSLKKTIKALKAQREKEIAQIVKSSGSASESGLDANPVYQQLKIALGEADANAAALKVRVDQYKAEVAKLENAVDTIPKVEADLKRLNRDYDINKKNYDALVQRRESAKISQQAGQNADDVKFRVVDPPFVGSDPVAPNRPLLISGVLVLGMVGGIAFAFFMSQIKPTYDSPRLITQDLGVPVFGSVSRVWTGTMRLKRRMDVLTFALGGAGLIGLYGTYMAYQIFIRGGA
jgi:polysaccharide chain length determinant protein (PEP-CTERM system associated)